MARPGVMLYFDMLEPIRVLSDEDKGRLLVAILEYGKDGVVPEFSGMLALAWGFVRPKIDRDLEELIGKLKPDVIAVEELFFNTNITTGIAVAHGRGVLLCAAERCGIPLYEYTPSQVKLAVTGYGKAEKRQVMDMTRRLLKLSAVPKPDDAADALALALCHARSFTSRIPQLDNVKQTI